MQENDPEVVFIIRSLTSGRFRLSQHAQNGMRQRGITMSDLHEVGRSCRFWKHQPSGRWLIEGFDANHQLLGVVCVYEGETVVITVIAY